MPHVNVTIDGVAGAVPSGSTVLDAAEQMGINIPTLCDHPAIAPIGACRMCLVEVEKQRTLQPACTFPVSEGMVVHTKSDKAVAAHKFVLQLLFSERNHYCMFCQMSGSCELQDLAYENGLDHWEFDRAYPKLDVDASRSFFVMDHNRCILCRRCIRVCDELVGNATLGLMNRGADTRIIADMGVPFGDSSCVACGTCLQVCPTGALIDRASAFMGANKEVERIKTRCTQCSIGCGAVLVVRDNRVIRVEGDWDADPNHGLLCQVGRFSLLYESRKRVRKPLVNGETADWDAALDAAANGLKAADGICSVVSGYASSEAAQAVAALPGSKALMQGGAVSESNGIAALDDADLYLVVATDLSKKYEVASFAIKRGIRQRGARLIIIDDAPNGLADWAMKTVSSLNDVLDIAKGAQSPVVVYDDDAACAAQSVIDALPNASVVALAAGANNLGLIQAGIADAFAANGAKGYFVLAGEACCLSDELKAALQGADFVVVQASFSQPWADIADVILPSPLPYEKSGSASSLSGPIDIIPGVSSKAPSELDVVSRLAGRL